MIKDVGILSASAIWFLLNFDCQVRFIFINNHYFPTSLIFTTSFWSWIKRGGFGIVFNFVTVIDLRLIDDQLMNILSGHLGS